MNKRYIGIHSRIEKSYSQMIEQTLETGANSCQFFFMPQETDKYLRLTRKDIEKFIRLKKENNFEAYGHCSYWINPSTNNKASIKVSKEFLRKEIFIAKKLGIDYLVLHAGSAKNFEPDPNDPKNKLRGIEAIAKLLHQVLRNEDQVTILIENTAHGGRTVCSDIQDFAILRSKLEKDINVKFCFDTSHAFAYGYELHNTEYLLELLDETMGIDNIKLIHLNNSKKPCGSKIDEHELPTKGIIGQDALKKFINHPKIKNVPIIIESPIVTFNEVKKVVEDVKNW